MTEIQNAQHIVIKFNTGSLEHWDLIIACLPARQGIPRLPSEQVFIIWCLKFEIYL